jgi:hypothetical protein
LFGILNEYNEECGVYAPAGADWIDIEANLEYRTTLIESEDEPPSGQGGSEKLHFDEEGAILSSVLLPPTRTKTLSTQM